MPAPTPAEVMEHVDTDLSDDALQRLIDSEWADIVQRFGSEDAPVDDLTGGGARIWLGRKADSITSVVERSADDTAITLATADYRVENGGWSLRRLDTGTNARGSWDYLVRVTYASDRAAIFMRVCIDLVKLAIQDKALESERVGDHSESHWDYQAEREKRMGSLLAAERCVA